MKELIADLRTRFDQLDKRERKALVSLVAFLVAVVFYLLVWTPANEFVAAGERDYSRHLKLLEYMMSTQTIAGAAGGKPSQSQGGRSLLSTVNRTAQTVGVSPNRIQPEGSNAVSVWFDSVAFTRLMLFLERLHSAQGIVVRQISIEGQDDAGKVSTRVVLRN